MVSIRSNQKQKNTTKKKVQSKNRLPWNPLISLKFKLHNKIYDGRLVFLKCEMRSLCLFCCD